MADGENGRTCDFGGSHAVDLHQQAVQADCRRSEQGPEELRDTDPHLPASVAPDAHQEEIAPCSLALRSAQPPCRSHPLDPVFKSRYALSYKQASPLSWRRRLGWRKGSMHGSTAQLQLECSPFHRGAVDFFQLAELLACRPIRANWRAMWSVWGVQRCALRPPGPGARSPILASIVGYDFVPP